MTTPALCPDATGFVAAATTTSGAATGEEAGVFATLLEELQPALEAALAAPQLPAEPLPIDVAVPPEAVLQGVPLPTLLPLHLPVPVDGERTDATGAATAAAAPAAAPSVEALIESAAPAGTTPVPAAPAAQPAADAAPAAPQLAAAPADEATAQATATPPSPAAPVEASARPVGAPQAAAHGEGAPDEATDAPATVLPGGVQGDAAATAQVPAQPAAAAVQPEMPGAGPEQVPVQPAPATISTADGPVPTAEAEASVRSVQPAVAELARGLKTAAAGHASLVVRLDPPELGAVLVRVQIRNGAVSVSCTTPDLGAVNALAFQRSDVMELLRGEGLDLSSFEVRQQETSLDGRRGQAESQPDEAMQREQEHAREGSRSDAVADEQSTTTDDAASRGTWL